MIPDHEDTKRSKIAAPLFDTKLDASKKVIELSDAALQMVSGVYNCSAACANPKTL